MRPGSSRVETRAPPAVVPPTLSVAPSTPSIVEAAVLGRDRAAAPLGRAAVLGEHDVARAPAAVVGAELAPSAEA